MKKILAIIISLFILTLLFSGCGSLPAADPAAVAENTEGSETAPVEQTVDAPEEAAEKYEPVTIRIGGLKGPTSIGMVKLLEDAENGLTLNNYEFTMAAAADVPANLASILYNRSEGGVKMAAVNTLGVIYIVEKGGETVNSIQDLKGRTIYATGKGTTPEYALTYLLAQNGLDIDRDVTMEWKSEPTEVVALMTNMDSAVAMLPQPFVTVAGTKLEGLRTALDLTAEWNRLDNGSAFITAGFVVRSAFADENPEAMKVFLEEYSASADYVNANPAEAAALVEKLDIVKAPVAEKAIPYCNIVCIPGDGMKTILSGYLQVLFDLNPASVGGAMPGDDFYWTGS